MSRRIAKKKTLFTVPTSPGEAPALRGGRCSCGHVFFPPQQLGCDACGAADDAIEIIELAGGGVLQTFATAHRQKRPGSSAPMIVGTVLLDDGPADLDVVEVHDAFSIEEVLYTKALGLCGEGEGAAFLAAGRSQIGGECAVSASGGLIAMGHPFGPTGVGQVAEVTRQVRGEAGVRQQPNARLGLAHMVGLGQVCLIHILRGTAR